MNLQNIHTLTQQVINAIANKQPKLAKNIITEAQKTIEQLIDCSTKNEELVELSKYQTLITLLNNKLK